jgi:methionine biosynthesis protein MetW
VDSVSEYYDQYWSDEGFNPGSNLSARLRALLVDNTNGHVLDVGCGDGDTAGLLLKEIGRTYVGVDVSRSGIEAARAKGLEALLIDDAAALPFEDGTFDSVVCIEVLEHLWLPNEATAEILRVLKPGGTFVATTPNVAFWRRRAAMLAFGRWNPFGDELSIEQPWRDPHIRFFTAGSFASMVGKAGFERVRVSGHMDVPLPPGPGWKGFIDRFEQSRLNSLLVRRRPSFFACRLNVTATKPLPG